MKFIERLKLRHRANKYKNKDDIGGIAYINASIKAGQIVLDIGAHKAGYLFFMRKLVGIKGKVFAFEPQSNLFAYIQKMKAMFRWDNVTIEHLALSDVAGMVKLFIPANKVSKSSSPGATIVVQNDNAEFGSTENVSTETLDQYCSRKDIQPQFLKIDVEGNELKVFQGGAGILKSCKPKIIVEIEARHVGEAQVLATFAFLKTFNYVGHILHGLEAVPLIEFSFAKYQNTADMNNYCNNFSFE